MTSPVQAPPTQVSIQRSLVVRHPTMMTSSEDDEGSRRCHIPGPRTGFAQPIAIPSKETTLQRTTYMAPAGRGDGAPSKM